MQTEALPFPEPHHQGDATTQHTLEEYFEFEFNADRKHEYFGGKIQAMAYTSPEHGRIQTNFMDELAACLKSKGCVRYTSDRMLFIEDCNVVFYPDIMIVCGEEEYKQYSKNMKATLNPSVLIEILSDSTEQDDRVSKWPCFKEIKSLKQFVLVNQKKASIESYVRTGEKSWAYTYASSIEEDIEILDCRLHLTDIYAGVEFQQA
ncbi:MAG: Uma2 family endonuclease [Saprospiraceae bacterium]|nr:Uma2 family endonuclease [Saprospiraceae bacterium]